MIRYLTTLKKWRDQRGWAEVMMKSQPELFDSLRIYLPSCCRHMLRQTLNPRAAFRKSSFTYLKIKGQSNSKSSDMGVSNLQNFRGFKEILKLL